MVHQRCMRLARKSSGAGSGASVCGCCCVVLVALWSVVRCVGCWAVAAVVVAVVVAAAWLRLFVTGAERMAAGGWPFLTEGV